MTIGCKSGAIAQSYNTPISYNNTFTNIHTNGFSDSSGTSYNFSVSSNIDGNIIVIGDKSDNSSIGASWVINNGTPSSKLVGTGNSGASQQGTDIAINKVGDIFITGSPYDNSQIGACWIFKNVSGTWTQQGSKLVPSDNVGICRFGNYLSISASGNVVCIGGQFDNSYIGASWVFKNVSGTWTQQGSKLVGSDHTGSSFIGSSVAISGDENTIIMGGPNDNSNVGAIWIFKNISGTWTQQGGKIVGTNNITAGIGNSVSTNIDGSIIVAGAKNDNTSIGAVFIFNGSGTQIGSKLLGDVNTQYTNFGRTVRLSENGNTLLITAGDTTQGTIYIFTNHTGSWAKYNRYIQSTYTLQNLTAISFIGNKYFIYGTNGSNRTILGFY
jgi:hypothetical protein